MKKPSIAQLAVLRDLAIRPLPDKLPRFWMSTPHISWHPALTVSILIRDGFVDRVRVYRRRRKVQGILVKLNDQGRAALRAANAHAWSSIAIHQIQAGRRREWQA